MNDIPMYTFGDAQVSLDVSVVSLQVFQQICDFNEKRGGTKGSDYNIKTLDVSSNYFKVLDLACQGKCRNLDLVWNQNRLFNLDNLSAKDVCQVLFKNQSIDFYMFIPSVAQLNKVIQHLTAFLIESQCTLKPDNFLHWFTIVMDNFCTLKNIGNATTNKSTKKSTRKSSRTRSSLRNKNKNKNTNTNKSKTITTNDSVAHQSNDSDIKLSNNLLETSCTNLFNGFRSFMDVMKDVDIGLHIPDNADDDMKYQLCGVINDLCRIHKCLLTFEEDKYKSTISKVSNFASLNATAKKEISNVLNQHQINLQQCNSSFAKYLVTFKELWTWMIQIVNKLLHDDKLSDEIFFPLLQNQIPSIVACLESKESSKWNDIMFKLTDVHNQVWRTCSRTWIRLHYNSITNNNFRMKLDEWLHIVDYLRGVKIDGGINPDKHNADVDVSTGDNDASDGDSLNNVDHVDNDADDIHFLQMFASVDECDDNDDNMNNNDDAMKKKENKEVTNDRIVARFLVPTLLSKLHDNIAQRLQAPQSPFPTKLRDGFIDIVNEDASIVLGDVLTYSIGVILIVFKLGYNPSITQKQIEPILNKYKRNSIRDMMINMVTQMLPKDTVSKHIALKCLNPESLVLEITNFLQLTSKMSDNNKINYNQNELLIKSLNALHYTLIKSQCGRVKTNCNLFRAPQDSWRFTATNAHYRSILHDSESIPSMAKYAQTRYNQMTQVGQYATRQTISLSKKKHAQPKKHAKQNSTKSKQSSNDKQSISDDSNSAATREDSIISISDEIGTIICKYLNEFSDNFFGADVEEQDQMLFGPLMMRFDKTEYNNHRKQTTFRLEQYRSSLYSSICAKYFPNVQSVNNKSKINLQSNINQQQQQQKPNQQQQHKQPNPSTGMEMENMNPFGNIHMDMNSKNTEDIEMQHATRLSSIQYHVNQYESLFKTERQDRIKQLKTLRSWLMYLFKQMKIAGDCVKVDISLHDDCLKYLMWHSLLIDYGFLDAQCEFENINSDFEWIQSLVTFFFLCFL